jgi:Lectin C-type domain
MFHVKDILDRRPWQWTGGRPGVWTGGQRIDPDDNETEFVWKNTSDDTSLPLTFTNWHTDEPNNWRGLKESCLQADLREGEHDWQWNDVECFHRFLSVCEVDI